MLDNWYKCVCYKIGTFPKKEEIEKLTIEDIKEAIKNTKNWDNLSIDVEEFQFDLDKEFNEIKQQMLESYNFFLADGDHLEYVIITSENCQSLYEYIILRIFFSILEYKFNFKLVAEHSISP